MWSWRIGAPVLGTEPEKGMLSSGVHQKLKQVPEVQTKSQGRRYRMSSYSFRDRCLLKPPEMNEIDQEEWVELKRGRREAQERTQGKTRDLLTGNKDLDHARCTLMLSSPGR